MVATEEQRVRVPSTGEQPQGLIVLCAGNNYDTVRVLDQHMADRLRPARAGAVCRSSDVPTCRRATTRNWRRPSMPAACGERPTGAGG